MRAGRLDIFYNIRGGTGCCLKWIMDTGPGTTAQSVEPRRQKGDFSHTVLWDSLLHLLDL
jgi:hypothetical protein